MHACMRACMAYYTIEKPAKAVTCMEAEAVSAAVDRPKLCRKFQVYNSNLNSHTCVTANVCRAMHASYIVQCTRRYRRSLLFGWLRWSRPGQGRRGIVRGIKV